MDIMENATNATVGVGAAGLPLGLLGAAALYGGRKSMGTNFLSGALSSFGADPLESGKVFKGSVFAFGEGSSDLLKNTLMGKGGTTINLSSARPFVPAGDLPVFTMGGQAGTLARGGLANLNALNFIAPMLFTGVGTVNAMMDNGISGGAEYLIQDAMGMAAANRNLNTVYSFNMQDVDKVASKFKLKANEITGAYTKSGATNDMGAVNIHRSMLGSRMLNTLVTSGGGIMGAGVGMEAGKTIGKFIGKSAFGEGYEGASGFAGAAFGGMIGAHIGAALTASIPRMLIGAAGIAATTMIAKGTYGMLESGFRKEQMRHSRGLNFASDTSQFMTQRAVTMRQRAMQSMHKSHLNARSAFGQEATITHMNRDMFSHYKR